MYTINSIKHKITLEAIDIKSEVNKENHKNNSIFECDSKIYYVFDKQSYDSASFSRSLVRFFEKNKNNINVDVNSFLKLVDKNNHQGIITCLLSASELFTNRLSFKTSKQSIKSNNFIIYDYEQEIKLAKIIVEAESWTKNMITMPSNFLTAHVFENYIKQQFKSFGSKIKIKVLHKKELETKKMGLLLGVGQGSTVDNEPRIIVIEYNNNPKSEKIALVGKGILHDTGGLNLKPSSALKNMHGDMTGAAVVMGTIYALAKANVKTNIVAVAPLTSNEINERSFKVNDVIRSYSGKTIEITNTDAEGRLILADAITFTTKDLEASTIVSIATLTGAIVVALGDVFAGYWVTNPQQAKDVELAAKQGCEAIWRMPFHSEFLKKLDSQIADYINCSESRDGSSIVAAEFLKIFSSNKNFIHFDVAGSNELKTTFIPSMLRTLFYFVQMPPPHKK